MKNLFTEFLEDTYGREFVSPKDETEFFLIRRYKDSVSKRLTERYKVLDKESRRLGAERISSLFSVKNPFMAMIPKEAYGHRYEPTLVPISWKNQP